nr:retrovirus-related Pol polyprotein from transposon TNT 1-94 [Tanacetum cinerariifolium]
MFHKTTKHTDVRYHWIRDAIEDGMFELNKVHTDDNASDMLTKAVAREKLKYHWIRDAIKDGMFELNKVHTDDNASDMLTKAVATEKLKICCSYAGMANSSS